MNFGSILAIANPIKPENRLGIVRVDGISDSFINQRHQLDLMASAAYRLESVRSRSGRRYWYLVKDLRVAGRKGKVRISLGARRPAETDLPSLRRQHRLDLESKAILALSHLAAPAYRARHLTRRWLHKLEELRFLWRSYRDCLSPIELTASDEDLMVRYVHGTTNVEGNTMTLGEVTDLLSEGIVPSDPDLREVNEIQNYREVLRFRDEYKGPVTLDLILNLHLMVQRNIDHHTMGVFRRTDDIGIRGVDIPLTPAILIEEELRDLIVRYTKRIEHDRGHPFEEAILFHGVFESIHPFTDGNGRIGREILNLMLMRHGLPPLMIGPDNRREYLDALRSGQSGDLRVLVRGFADILVGQRLARTWTALRQRMGPDGGED